MEKRKLKEQIIVLKIEISKLNKELKNRKTTKK